MRKAIALTVKAAVSGLLLYFTLAAVNIGAVKARLYQIDPRWVAAGLMLLFAQLTIQAVRWELLVVRCGGELPLPRAFRFSVIDGRGHGVPFTITGSPATIRITRSAHAATR